MIFVNESPSEKRKFVSFYKGPSQMIQYTLIIKVQAKKMRSRTPIHRVFRIGIPLKPVLGGMRDVALFIISHEQTQ